MSILYIIALPCDVGNGKTELFEHVKLEPDAHTFIMKRGAESPEAEKKRRGKGSSSRLCWFSSGVDLLLVLV